MTDDEATPPGYASFLGGAMAMLNDEWFEPDTCQFHCSACGIGIKWIPSTTGMCPKCCGTTGHAFTFQRDPDGAPQCHYCGLRKPNR